MNRTLLSKRLKALADPTRLEILSLLPDNDRCEGVYNVSELADETRITQPSVSYHMNILKSAKLVKSRKMCRDVYYWIDRKELDAVRRALSGISK